MKNFKYLIRGGRVLLLYRCDGLFGGQWTCFGDFVDREGNAERGKQIIKQLNKCAEITNKPNDND